MLLCYPPGGTVAVHLPEPWIMHYVVQSLANNVSVLSTALASSLSTGGTVAVHLPEPWIMHYVVQSLANNVSVLSTALASSLSN